MARVRPVVLVLGLLLLLAALEGGWGVQAGVAVMSLETVADVEVAVHIPATPPTRILLAFHGCSHGAVDWMPADHCAECQGLPEEMEVVRQALARGYAVFAPSSVDRTGRKCWSHRVDGPRIVKMYHALLHLHMYPAVATATEQMPQATLPVFAFGASSGGYFAASMPLYLPSIINAAVPQVATLPTRKTEQFLDAATKGGEPFPPILFLHMERDERTNARVKDILPTLRRRGIQAAAVTLKPRKLQGYLAARISRMDAQLEAKVIDAFVQKGVVDAGGKLVDDPRQSDWRAALQHLDLHHETGDSLKPDQSVRQFYSFLSLILVLSNFFVRSSCVVRRRRASCGVHPAVCAMRRAFGSVMASARYHWIGPARVSTACIARARFEPRATFDSLLHSVGTLPASI